MGPGRSVGSSGCAWTDHQRGRATSRCAIGKSKQHQNGRGEPVCAKFFRTGLLGFHVAPNGLRSALRAGVVLRDLGGDGLVGPLGMLLLVAQVRPLPTEVAVARIELACLAASRAALAPEGVGSLISNQAEKLMVDRKCRAVPGYEFDRGGWCDPPARVGGQARNVAGPGAGRVCR